MGNKMAISKIPVPKAQISFHLSVYARHLFKEIKSGVKVGQCDVAKIPCGLSSDLPLVDLFPINSLGVGGHRPFLH